MEEKKPTKTSATQAAPKYADGRCESCEFYDYDEISDSYYCQMDLDQDEFASFALQKTSACPYYRFYDEYKSVHKQI